MYCSYLPSPVGLITLIADEDAVHTITFEEQQSSGEPSSTLSEEAKKQLSEYFEGKRLEFDFPYRQNGTPFQQMVWDELVKIQIGYPISYTQLSRHLNNPLAIRAIASANGKNNLAIVVPCHRVIGHNGDLVGYAGGLWRKQWLLEHEARITGIGQATLIF